MTPCGSGKPLHIRYCRRCILDSFFGAFIFQNSRDCSLLFMSWNRHFPQRQESCFFSASCVLQINLFAGSRKHIEATSLSLLFLQQSWVCVHNSSPRNSEATAFPELALFCHKTLKLFCKTALSNSCVISSLNKVAQSVLWTFKPLYLQCSLGICERVLQPLRLCLGRH